MMSTKDSFQDWLLEQIELVLGNKRVSPPLLVWCDPNREWLELLRIAASSGGFELWADPSEHELILRDRFYNTERAPRVIWLPCGRDEITWFKVFELEAEAVWERSLLEALREYGVRIPREFEHDLVSLLPAHACEWFEEPHSTWKDLTPGSAKGVLIDDHRVLEVLAGDKGEFEQLGREERFGVFARRAVEDFGLPDPTGTAEESWRVAATARLLATEAAHSCPQNPPREGESIIPRGLPRENTLRLLKLWQSHIRFIPSFETLVQEADKTLGLSYWARNLDTPPRSKSSRAVEETLFTQMADRFDRIEEIDLLARELEQHIQNFQDRSAGFWEQVATHRIGWRYLEQLAEAASLLVENARIEKTFKTASDAVTWYTHNGWMLDQAGELLFIESPDLPKQLHRVRARLRRGFLRRVDQVGRTFSDLLTSGREEVFSLPSAGEVVMGEIERSKTPTALVFLDACSLQFGHRLAAIINKGEPAERATIRTAIAPIPSITALGMAFALPMERKQLQIAFTEQEGNFQVTANGFAGNLRLAKERRKWLSARFDVKDFLTIADVLDSEKLRPGGKARRLIIVEGDDLDKEGHEGQLELTGADEHLERYGQAFRKLKAAGYNRIIVVTDHGFFHWQPDADEVEDAKPDGKVLWCSRRAVIGRNLKHMSAVHLPVPCSDLEAMVPRSINAFRTYGGLGYFHGGATLQELIIPVLLVHWPAKAAKIHVVLKPVGHITSEMPRVQVQAGVRGQLTTYPDSTKLARRVAVKVREPSSGKLVFRHSDAIIVEPGGKAVTIQLQLVEPRPNLAYGAQLVVEALDADDEELLAREEVILKVDIDEW
jgi:hypothetical protein